MLKGKIRSVLTELVTEVTGAAVKTVSVMTVPTMQSRVSPRS